VERREGGAGAYAPCSHLVARGVDERVEGSDEAFGGHAGAEVTAAAASVDQRLPRPRPRVAYVGSSAGRSLKVSR
jgi:hypothetical protein